MGDVRVGYGPPDLQSAYKLSSAAAGSGQTVAIVDAYDDPNAAADLATYRAAWGLPPCGSGCFKKVNQNGQASPLPAAAGTVPNSVGWDQEESLDVDMVSAICPLCHIILVEAGTNSIIDLGQGVNAAVSLGAKFVSNSYGGAPSAADLTYDSQYYNHPGVAVTASAGDCGYRCGVAYPATSPYVTSVGGTSLITASNARGWTETVWPLTGSGCSAIEAKPSWQTGVYTSCAKRADNDVAAVADPNTGVAVYDTYSLGGWAKGGGTSAASPIIASVFALAGTPTAGTYPSSYIYQEPGRLFDTTSGNNGSCGGTVRCTAGPGYDDPTGWGTPDGTGDFVKDPVTVTNPGPQSGYRGHPVTLQIIATDSDGYPLTYQATGLPQGLRIRSSTGLISGTPTLPWDRPVTVTATDTRGAYGSATFNWTVCTPTICP
jgi:subtilase family serine protease